MNGLERINKSDLPIMKRNLIESPKHSFLLIEKWMVDICDGDAVKAAILAVIRSFWESVNFANMYAKNSNQLENKIEVRLSTADIHKYTYGLISTSTIKRKIKEIPFLIKQKNPSKTDQRCIYDLDYRGINEFCRTYYKKEMAQSVSAQSISERKAEIRREQEEFEELEKAEKPQEKEVTSEQNWEKFLTWVQINKLTESTMAVFRNLETREDSYNLEILNPKLNQTQEKIIKGFFKSKIVCLIEDEKMVDLFNQVKAEIEESHSSASTYLMSVVVSNTTPFTLALNPFIYNINPKTEKQIRKEIHKTYLPIIKEKLKPLQVEFE